MNEEQFDINSLLAYPNLFNDQSLLDHIYNNDIYNKSSIVAKFAESMDFDVMMNALSTIRGQLSKINFDRLLHTNHKNLEISFNKHLLFVTYSKFGIEKTDLLLEKYYNNNKLFYVLSIDDHGKTIIHLEHYKRNKKMMELIEQIKSNK